MSLLDIFFIALSFAVAGWFVRLVTAKDRDDERHEEDDARTYFDEHGYWPDETEADAAARRAQGDTAERVARAYED